MCVRVCVHYQEIKTEATKARGEGQATKGQEEEELEDDPDCPPLE